MGRGPVNGRSETIGLSRTQPYWVRLHPLPLLPGAHVGAQTYKSVRRYYREHRGSRGHAVCPASGCSIPCEMADEQIGKVVEAVELGPR